MPALPRDIVQRGEARLHEFEPALGAFDEVRALRDRALVAIDADHAAIGGLEHQARVTAGAEGAVDINAAVLEIEEIQRGRTEHGSVTSQSASDSRFPAVAARHLSRAPRGSAAMPWALRRFRSLRTAPVASESCLPKRSGAQI